MPAHLITRPGQGRAIFSLFFQYEPVNIVALERAWKDVFEFASHGGKEITETSYMFRRGKSDLRSPHVLRARSRLITSHGGKENTEFFLPMSGKFDLRALRENY